MQNARSNCILRRGWLRHAVGFHPIARNAAYPYLEAYKTMARSNWKGSISFGLVNIPVSLTAAESRPNIQLHMVDSKNHARIRYERVNADTGKEVPWDRLVKGCEHEEGQFILPSMKR